MNTYPPRVDAPMVVDDRPSLQIQRWIDRLQAGDGKARDELLNHASGRLLALTRIMCRDFRRLGRWEQTEDVCQNASVRLWTALKAATPATVADFYRLAAVQIRRELIDLARRHFGPQGMGANHASNLEDDVSGSTPPKAYDPMDSTHEPAKIASWAEFHEKVEALPEVEREAFDLLWYQGLPQAEAAEVAGISEPTLRRRWRSARILISRALDGESPA